MNFADVQSGMSAITVRHVVRSGVVIQVFVLHYPLLWNSLLKEQEAFLLNCNQLLREVDSQSLDLLAKTSPFSLTAHITYRFRGVTLK